MTDEVLEAYVRQMIEGPERAANLGRLPGRRTDLDGAGFLPPRREYAKKYAPPGAQLEYSLQTNGTLLNEAWCDFFRDNNFLVGLSVDGPRAMHDAYRVDKGGGPTFDKVMRAARLMQERKVEFNILCTVHAMNASHPVELYRFFRDEVKTQFIQFIPIVERATHETLEVANEGWGDRREGGRPLYTQAGSLVTERSVGSEQWGQFLIAIFDEWVRRDVGTVFVQMFDAALASWVGAPPAICIFGETCGNALAMEHNGDLYSCDHYVEPDFPAGQHHAGTHDRTRRIGQAAQVRHGQTRLAAEILPRMHGSFRLPRRMPAQPLHPDARRRTRSELPVRGLHGVLQARGSTDAHHERTAAPRAARRPRSCRSSPRKRPSCEKHSPKRDAMTRAHVAAVRSSSSATVA